MSGGKDDTIDEDDIFEEEEDNSDDGSEFEADSVTCNSPRLRLLSVSTYNLDLDTYIFGFCDSDAFANSDTFADSDYLILII